MSAGIVWIVTASAAGAYAQSMTDEAQRIYQAAHQSVVQVQVIDLATGKKASIGSGFQFSAEGDMATNFHVVAEAVHAPQRFRVEYVRHDGLIGPLEVRGIDVIHDLAVVRSPEKQGTSLLLGRSDLSKGTHLFAMGNPFDLGMSIVDGIYNGLMEDSLYKKILFSGSINPGMSGGPALDKEGRVVGINVATAGNEVSFLVPVEHLQELYSSVSGGSLAGGNWQKVIDAQLAANQDQYMHRLLAAPWNTLEAGEAKVPGEILDVFKCWGKSEDKEKQLYNYAYIQCSTSDNIFLSNGFSTGQILYKYLWLTSKGLNPFRFYNFYQSRFQYPNPYENAGEDDVTNFKCDNNFVDIGGRTAKVLWCARQYKKFPGLYDINFSLASTDRPDRGFMMEVVALGTGKTNAVEFVRKFMKAVQWQNLSSK
ncbi:MAG: trypsin-like peptidase domain-containing protein [Candidatus Omnitrophica bacterium]|nr:trypsin-like peptidase domain-containing protein [Candidatus Omnitrophota bacterium]